MVVAVFVRGCWRGFVLALGKDNLKTLLFGVLYKVDVYTCMYICNFKYTYAHVIIIYVCKL